MADHFVNVFSFLQINVCEAQGLLAKILCLEFVFLVEPDLAQRSQRTGAFAVLVNVPHDNAKLIVAGAAASIQLAERHGTVRYDQMCRPSAVVGRYGEKRNPLPTNPV
jgi:hypothetical protein